MDPVGSEPARDRSAAEARVPGRDSADATQRQTERVSDVTPLGLNIDGRADSALLRLYTMVGNLGRYMRYMRHQATDSSSRNYPPKWLKILFALWILWLGMLIIWLIIEIIKALGLGILVLISKTRWAQVVLGSVHSYLDTHSAALPFSPEQLFLFWVLLGIVLFFFSFMGSIGGRIGWTAFGIETGAVVWAETPEPSKWLATGFTALLWSLLSTLAYRRKKNKTPSHFVEPFMGSIGRFAESFAAPESLDAIESRAEQNARRRGYADLADYFDNNANRPRDIIAADLGIPSGHVLELLVRYFPQGPPSHRKISPKDEREIVNEVLVEKKSRAEVARRRNLSSSTVSKVIKEYEYKEANKETD
jgi:hypothetical protein